MLTDGQFGEIEQMDRPEEDPTETAETEGLYTSGLVLLENAQGTRPSDNLPGTMDCFLHLAPAL